MASVEELRWEYGKLKEDLAAFRKSGKDVKVAELKAMSIPLKMRLAEATGLRKDIDKVEVLIKDVQGELSEVAEKNEAVMLLCQLRIAQIREAVMRNSMELARAYYEQVRSCYSRLSAGEREQLLPQLRQVAAMMQPGNVL